MIFQEQQIRELQEGRDMESRLGQTEKSKAESCSWSVASSTTRLQSIHTHTLMAPKGISFHYEFHLLM